MGSDWDADALSSPHPPMGKQVTKTMVNKDCGENIGRRRNFVLMQDQGKPDIAPCKSME